MKRHLRIIQTIVFLMLCCLPMDAQLNGTGFYRFRNASRTNDYISLTNDLFNYHIVASNAGGGLTQLYLYSAAKQRAMDCAGKYLATDIHMVEDADCINPASVIYAQKRNTNASNYDYNLIGQGTSLLTLTTGTYAGNATLKFENLYITIKPSSGSGENTKYTAQIALKASNNSMADLGVRYFVDNTVDNKGTFAISESSTAEIAKWYIEPVNHFNVQPEVEFNGKYYTTLYVPYAFTLSGQVENAYVVTAINADGTLETEKVATNGGTVPAGTPVLLECGSNVAAECQLIPKDIPLFTAPDISVTSGGAPRALGRETTDYTGTNLLQGNYYCNTDGNITYTTNGGTSSFNANHYTARTNSMYVVGITASGKLGFVAATGTAMPANKAWLEYTGSAELVLPFEKVSLGDVNNDTKITIADVTALVNILRGGDTSQYDPKAADVDENDDINLDDVSALVNMILNQE